MFTLSEAGTSDPSCFNVDKQSSTHHVAANRTDKISSCPKNQGAEEARDAGDKTEKEMTDSNDIFGKRSAPAPLVLSVEQVEILLKGLNYYQHVPLIFFFFKH